MDSFEKYIEVSNYIDNALLYNTITEAMAESLYDEAFNKYFLEDGDNNSQPIVISLDSKLQAQRKNIIALIALCIALSLIVAKIIKEAEKDPKQKGKINKLKKIINFLSGNKLALKELQKKNAELCRKGHNLKVKYDNLNNEHNKTKQENDKLKETNEKLKNRIKAMQAERNETIELADKVSTYNNRKKKAESIKNSSKERKEKGIISKEEYQENIKKYNEIQKKLESNKSDIIAKANELKNSNTEYAQSIGDAIGKCMNNMK